jgi:endogenous inhibitor of DNA gyrase (YacG/DUF329 family)
VNDVSNVFSIRVARNQRGLIPSEDRARFEKLWDCGECGEPADWGSLDEGMAFCQEHAPWVDKALAAAVRQAVTPADLAAWLQERPESWRVKQETFQGDIASEAQEFESFAEADRGEAGVLAHPAGRCRRWQEVPGRDRTLQPRLLIRRLRVRVSPPEPIYLRLRSSPLGSWGE